MRRVYIADSLIDGQLVVNGLCDAGVPAELFHQNASGGLGELPVTYPEVWIRRDLDQDKALRVVTALTQDNGDFPLVDCPQCGENNPANFEICWQCRSHLPTG